MATLGHIAEQPGIRGHSFSEDNLLKQYLVFEHVESGRLAVKSFEKLEDAFEWIMEQPETVEFLIKDQFDKDKIIYNEKLGDRS